MPETTTRAYSLRLAELDEPTWRKHVWNTHCTMNRGVWSWGDFLLTLRGGLPAALADIHPERRVILALSWLSVEAPASLAPACVPDSDKPSLRAEAVLQRFREILREKGVGNTDEWENACKPALTARIRDDAVWIDRYARFKELAAKFNGELTVEWATVTFLEVIGGEQEFFAMPDMKGEAQAEAKDFVIKAGNWLSANWGSGVKSDASSIGTALTKLAPVPNEEIVGRTPLAAMKALIQSLGGEAQDSDPLTKLEKSLKQLIGWKGRPSKGAMALAKLVAAEKVTPDLWDQVRNKFKDEAEEQLSRSGAAPIPDWMPQLRARIEAQIGVPFRTTKDHIWEHAVMLDHALRRVSAAHTWIKRAEASRREFQEAAVGIKQHVPPAAQEWLDSYCESRSAESGAAAEYLIRRGALDGWEEVLRKWKKCKNRKERVEAAREVQRDWPDDKKFGDIQLFAGAGDADEEARFPCLADDNADAVWKNKSGEWDSTVLEKYVAARIAEDDQARFKVPAYRHPDPLCNPVWVDFGNSRWNIQYSVLEVVQRRRKLQEKLAKAKANTARERTIREPTASNGLQTVMLGLWTGQTMEPVTLRWHGKRFRRDLGLDNVDQSGTSVPRADRFARAWAGAATSTVNVPEVFNQSDWSGRLQANRAELQRLADLIYRDSNGKKVEPSYELLATLSDKARKRWERLRWFLSHSAKLKPDGPWLRYIASDDFKSSEWQWVEGRNESYPLHPANKGRKGRTRLILARLPGLRILSFDLGHRYAAACAVWETLSRKNILAEIAGRHVRAGGTSAGDLYVHAGHEDGKGNLRTTIYRRIGPDSSNAPWARLDRQFVIKLQGEEGAARRPTADEIANFKRHLESLGRKDVESLATRRGVDKLMYDGALELRRALRRHGDVARVANAFQSSVKQLAGGRVYHFFEPNARPDDSPQKRAENYREFLLDALVVWYDLKEGRKWGHREAAGLWNQYVAPHVAGVALQSETDDESGAERKRRLKTVEQQLRDCGVADRLADDQLLRATLAKEFTKVWDAEEVQWLGKEGHLRWLRNWILPRLGRLPVGGSPEFSAWKSRLRQLRNVGGLSLDRLTTIRMLYQIMRSYYSGPEPANLRAGIERIERDADRGYRFGARMLDMLERLRENRIKQLASRIVEAAVGVGSENRRKHWSRRKETSPPTLRPRERVFEPCHAVVGESLKNYRPEETRMRRENRRLRDWAARNVRKYIVEGCELNGLYFAEVSPSYTSRQDSRTGAPGVRCSDVGRDIFAERNDVKAAAKRWSDGGEAARDQYLVRLLAHCGKATDSARASSAVRVPVRGGEIFVSSDARSPAAKGIQADLNAAANIGLKALTDPDWEGAWWYIPVKSKDGTTEQSDFPGCPLFEAVVKVLDVADSDRGDKEGVRKSRERTNAWSHVSVDPFAHRARRWLNTAAYWNSVEKCVVKHLAVQSGIGWNDDRVEAVQSL